MLADLPKMLQSPEAKAKRMLQLGEPHIHSLTTFVDQLRESAGPGVGIPYFDPWDGGVDAEALFLLEAPGAKAVASGFISRNNPDETAKNMFELGVEAGIDRKHTVLWNVVPWYIGTGTKIRAATPLDLEAGLQPLPRLLALLPKLRTVVLLGRKAEKAAATIASVRPDLKLFICAHPSPLYVNNATGNREKILKILRQVSAHLQQR
ncbi:uracil-DNA glycosylase [Pseudomonas sp. B22129]|uniref:uracil-DNA glycosylase n=1 Tax=Pseudomonas sp. B22129 TaxID=3235111 RepID=UPI003784E04C